MKKSAVSLLVGILLFVIFGLAAAEDLPFKTYLPVVMKPQNTPTSTSTPSPTPTLTPSQTPSPTATFTATPVPRTGRVNILTVFYDGVVSAQEPDEYVEIKNIETFTINLTGWTLRDNANHVFNFPASTILPNQVCRIYTNQSHPEWCGYNYGSSSAIWNNDGDCAILRNYLGEQVAQRCY